MNIKTFVPDGLPYYDSEWYLCEVDLEQKNKHKIANTDIELFIDSDKAMNHRDTHPNVGVIKQVGGKKAQFKVGDSLMVKHFCFTDSKRKPKIYHTDDSEKDYYLATPRDIMFGIVDGELVPRVGILLCESLEGKFIETKLHLSADLQGKRRDIARVLKVGESVKDIKEGDLILLANGGDYAFTWNHKDYLKVDTLFNDALMVVDSEDWKVSELRKHAKHENTYKYGSSKEEQ